MQSFSEHRAAPPLRRVREKPQLIIRKQACVQSARYVLFKDRAGFAGSAKIGGVPHFFVDIAQPLGMTAERHW